MRPMQLLRKVTRERPGHMFYDVVLLCVSVLVALALFFWFLVLRALTLLVPRALCVVSLLALQSASRLLSLELARAHSFKFMSTYALVRTGVRHW